MLVFAPAVLLSFLALISSVAGGAVRGVARGVVGPDAGNFVKRAEGAATTTTIQSGEGALLGGRVHQKLHWSS